jgi:phosphopantetheine--protein transferase-like protein
MDVMATGALEPGTSARLRMAVAEFFKVDAADVGSSFSLQGRHGQGSIARAALDSLIRRRVGLISRSVYTARTYGELEAELMPGKAASVLVPASSPDEQAANPSGVASVVRCGIDIELIDHLPRVADCWEDSFYRDHFTAAEIAHCLLQEAPALHFTARWCAKEALKKCDGAFLATAMKDIEVVAGNAGQPFLVHHSGADTHRLPHALSLSHVPHAAIAVVVAVDLSTPIPRSSSSDVPPPAQAPPRRRYGFVSGLLSFIALCVALGALLRTFWIVQ